MIFMARIVPTKDSIERFLLDMIRHSNNVEYYLNHLGLFEKKGQSPHDLVGRANKLEWRVVKGLALTYDDIPDDKMFFEKYILPSIEYHRIQNHHQTWNKYNPDASVDERRVGAVDASCALRESRLYKGGRKQEDLGRKHNWNEVHEKLIDKNERVYIRKAAEYVVPKMQRIHVPKLGLIEDIFDFPNIGIREETYLKMKDRIPEAVDKLRKYVDVF